MPLAVLFESATAATKANTKTKPLHICGSTSLISNVFKASTGKEYQGQKAPKANADTATRETILSRSKLFINLYIIKSRFC
ncbi:hypothetical protein DSM107010_05720 [Chroococcidiopsis cubana SAG 39.79]|uniref:Uncharacterized protein n=1 Tax=Chroococcidiopsis cubana SAG 39.79 TaxID=388085 RepID=A0AB37URN2_9CYAN|nr:hypothetical protein DSM107010_05720 [Chroococcidiopsis cubana SAG 39.79]